MKKLITLIAIMASISSFGQTNVNENAFNLIYNSSSAIADFKYKMSLDSSWFKKVPYPTENALTIGRKSIELITIKQNGDFYYLPSAFCDCDKCKNKNKMKFLYNIYKQ